MQRFLSLIILALAMAPAPALATPWEGARLGAAFSGGWNNLEGPAITGTDDREGEDEAGFGFKLFGSYGFADHFFARSAYDFTLYSGDLSLHEFALGAGAGLPLYRSGDLGFYAAVIPALEIAVTDGTRNLAATLNGSGAMQRPWSARCPMTLRHRCDDVGFTAPEDDRRAFSSFDVGHSPARILDFLHGDDRTGLYNLIIGFS